MTDVLGADSVPPSFSAHTETDEPAAEPVVGKPVGCTETDEHGADFVLPSFSAHGAGQLQAPVVPFGYTETDEPVVPLPQLRQVPVPQCFPCTYILPRSIFLLR